MPTYVVTGPDGKRYRVTAPEGASEADVMARVSGQAKPTSFWQGVAEGIQKPATNAVRMLAKTNPLGMLADAATGVVRNTAGAMDQGAEAAKARSPYQGSTAGRITGGIVGSLPTALLPGGAVAQGAYGGAAMTNDINDVRGTAIDAAIGATAGKLGQQVGKRVLAPVAERIGRTAPVRRLGEAAAKAVGKAPLPLPKVTKAERVVARATPDLAPVRQNVADAARLKLPYALADADPRLRTLGGSVARFSPDARAMAEKNFGERALGQADRAVNSIDELLAPITNIEQRAGQIKTAAQGASAPFYEQARSMPAPIDDELTAMLRTPAGKEALAKARQIAMNSGKNPDELGFVFDANGDVSLRGLLDNEVGRFAKARIGNEREELAQRVVRTWNGGEVAKQGPIDLVGWLRTKGGLKNQGGELSHMGLNNRARSMDLVGREAEFGPLVNDADGLNLDDAAMRAWEAGYFPELTDRPTINEFLDAVRNTWEGRQRRFLPDDLPEVDRYFGAQQQKYALRDARFSSGVDPSVDRSVPAGERPFPPVEAYDVVTARDPSFETLQLVKRGLDAKLSGYRNPITRKLDLEGNPEAQSISDLLSRFNQRLGVLNEPYKQGNAAYASEIARRDSLRLGHDMAANNVPQRQFDEALNRQSDKTLAELRRGYATAMADTVNRQRFSGNPYNAVYGSPLQQGKIGSLFNERGSRDFSRLYDLEKEMAKTATETLGGSQTQPRAIADSMFQNDMANSAADAGIQMMTGGGVPGATKILGELARAAKDRSQLGLLGAKNKADALAPQLFDTSNPQGILDFLDGMARKAREEELRKQAYQRTFGLLGVPSAAVGVGSTR